MVSNQGPFVVSVNPDLPVKSLPELIAYGKARPGRCLTGSIPRADTAWWLAVC